MDQYFWMSFTSCQYVKKKYIFKKSLGEMGPVISDYDNYVQNDQYTTIGFAQYAIKCKHLN